MGKGSRAKARGAFLEEMAEAEGASDAGQKADLDAKPKLSRKEMREAKLKMKAERQQQKAARDVFDDEADSLGAQEAEDSSERGNGSKKSSRGKKATKEPTFYGNPEDDSELAEKMTELSLQTGNIDADGDDAAEKPKKKLSNKERRKLKDQAEAAARDAYLVKRPLESTDFAVSAVVPKEDDAWLNATDINISNFSISAYGKTLFQNADLKITAGRKYGIVGPNGRGKSTLLIQMARGELPIPPKVDCLYVEQEVRADDTPAVEMVLQADVKRTELMKRENEIITLLESEAGDNLSLEEHEKLQHELKEVGDELRARGNDSAEAQALMLLNGLGFTKEMQRAPTKTFSGGWRMRVSIARALFVGPTLMLLDEPTNHLDLNAVLWLDQYLQKWKKTLIIVSHDEDFLDSVCTDIIHLDQQRLFYFRGNFSSFKSQVEGHKMKMIKEYREQERRLKALKAKGKMTNKAAADKVSSRSKREAGGSKKGGKRSNTDQASDTAGSPALLEKPKDYMVEFVFPEPTELVPPIISVDEVSFAYPGGKRLFKKLSFGIDMDSRITIVGNNGVGKSTLLKLITGELEPTKGEVKINRHLRIARYHQHFLDVLPQHETPVEFLRREYDCTYQEARNRLGKFGLEGSAHVISMNKCSGGQKSRVVFASMSFQRPHILILDEPTNNLDLESIDALIESINNFEGGVVVVTHDARLIQATDCRLWVCDSQTVKEHRGGFEAYRDEILDDLAKQAEEERKLAEEKQRRADELRRTRLAEIDKRMRQKAERAKASQ